MHPHLVAAHLPSLCHWLLVAASIFGFVYCQLVTAMLLLMNLSCMQVGLYPSDTASWLLSNEGASILAAALRGHHLEKTAGPAVQMQQHLLQAVNIALSAEPSLATSSVELEQLVAALRELEISKDDDVKTAAAQAAHRLCGSRH